MGWASYHPFTAAFHQSCLIYLLRRWRDLIRDHPPPLPARVEATLQASAQRALHPDLSGKTL